MYYHSPTLANSTVEEFPQSGALLGGNRTEAVARLAVSALPETLIQCTRERPVLCLLLMLGTLWMGYTLYQFKRRYVQRCSTVHSHDWRSWKRVWMKAAE